MNQGKEEIFKSLQETIEKTKKALAGLDRGAALPKYRETHKRLKRAQRSLTKWKKVAAKLEEKKKSELKKAAKKKGPAKTEAAAAKTEAAAAETAKEKPAKKKEVSEKKEASGKNPAAEPAPTS